MPYGHWLLASEYPLGLTRRLIVVLVFCSALMPTLSMADVLIVQPSNNAPCEDGHDFIPPQGMFAVGCYVHMRAITAF